METNRRGEAVDKQLARRLDRHVVFLEEALAEVDRDIGQAGPVKLCLNTAGFQRGAAQSGPRKPERRAVALNGSSTEDRDCDV